MLKLHTKSNRKAILTETTKYYLTYKVTAKNRVEIKKTPKLLVREVYSIYSTESRGKQ